MLSRCGLDCEACDFYQKTCQGCYKQDGAMFWGKCRVANCAIEKQHHHCGECKSFACELLKSFAYDPDQGDNGERIKNLETLMKN